MSTLAAALEYARAGLAVFPAPPGTKMSYKAARWYGGRRWGATKDAEEIKNDWQRWPDANVCIVTGKDSGIFVTETDNKNGINGDATLNELQGHFGALPNTLRACSPSGSVHWYWIYPSDGRVVVNDVGRKLGVGVDVRGEGGMVVAPPSLRDGEKYRWVTRAPIVNAPSWLLSLVAAFPLQRKAEAEEVSDTELVRAAVAVIPPSLSWHERNKIGMAIWKATGGTGFEIWSDWLRSSGRYDHRHAVRRWLGITNSKPNNIGMGTLMFCASVSDSSWLVRYDKQLAEA